MSTNYTVEAACPANSTEYSPPESAGTRTSTPACAVLAGCNNNTDKLRQCCDNGTGNLVTFDRGGYKYAYCTIASTEPDDYRIYQNCLFDQGTFPFHCNALIGPTPDTCDPQGYPPPAVPSEGEESCSVRNSPNASAVLKKCCKGTGTGNDTIITTYIQGCMAFCVAADGLSDCLTTELGARSFGCSYRGSNNTDSGDGNSSDDGDGNGNEGVAPRSNVGYMQLGVLFLAMAAFLQ